MDVLPEDELLLRQREKLNAHAEWMQQQQHQHQQKLQRAHRPPSDDFHDNGNIFPESSANGSTHPNNGSPQQRWPPQNDVLFTVSLERGQNEAQCGSRRESAKPERSPIALSQSADDSHFVTPRGGSVSRVQKRNALWLFRREQKLEEQRMRRVEDYSECTFTPRINRHGSAARDSLSQAPGFNEFVYRQERARQMAREKQERREYDGSKWTGARTVSEPFVLGRRVTAERIPSLRQPVPNVPGTAGAALDAPCDREEETALRGGRVFSLESIATVVGRGLPPPGAFSSWSALQYRGGENSADTSCH